MSRIFNSIKWFAKKNVAFFLGLVFGSTVGTITTIVLFMGYYGVSETLEVYQQVICGG